MHTKIVDTKGRISLGAAFSGRTVLIDDTDPQRIVITPAVVIPEKEAWLYANQDALNAVRQGLDQAKHGKFSKKKIDLQADRRLAGQMDD